MNTTETVREGEETVWKPSNHRAFSHDPVMTLALPPQGTPVPRVPLTCTPGWEGKQGVKSSENDKDLFSDAQRRTDRKPWPDHTHTYILYSLPPSHSQEHTHNTPEVVWFSSILSIWVGEVISILCLTILWML